MILEQESLQGRCDPQEIGSENEEIPQEMFWYNVRHETGKLDFKDWSGVEDLQLGHLPWSERSL